VEQGFCGAPKTFDDILNKQGCPKIHKQPCATNIDCACADAEYVCEKELFSTKKECVSKKPIHEQKKKQEGETCSKNSDCEELFYACVDGTCQVDFSSFGEDSSFMENLFGKNAVKKEKQKSWESSIVGKHIRMLNEFLKWLIKHGTIDIYGWSRRDNKRRTSNLLKQNIDEKKKLKSFITGIKFQIWRHMSWQIRKQILNELKLDNEIMTSNYRKFKEKPPTDVMSGANLANQIKI